MKTLALTRAALIALCFAAATAGAANAQTRNRAVVAQQGTAHAAAIVQNGQGNRAGLVQYGRANTGAITQDGTNNTACLVQLGRGLDGAIAQRGDNNGLAVIQTHSGAHVVPARHCEMTETPVRGGVWRGLIQYYRQNPNG